MLELKITADNPQDLRNQLSALLGGTAAVAASVAVEQPADKPAATRKKAEPKADPTPASTEAATSSEAQSSAAGSVTKEQVTALCNQYGAKAGATALQEIFKNEMGSPQGKFSGVTEDKYPALAARLTELLNA